ARLSALAPAYYGSCPVASARIGKCQAVAGLPRLRRYHRCPRTPCPGPGPVAMTNVYSLDGILVFGLLFVCTCAYFKKVPRLKTWLLSEKKGVWGVFYKAAVIGTRLHAAVAIACVVMAFYVLFIK
ncbi:Protein kish-B, partial [Camelus dromedarius]